MTETYFLSSSKQTREGQEPTRAPFCFAFDTVKTRTGFFGWLEGEAKMTADTVSNDDGYTSFQWKSIFAWLSLFDSVETGPGAILPPSRGNYPDITGPENDYQSDQLRKKSVSHIRMNSQPCISKSETVRNPNRFRLERFGKAMSGTGSWEAPGAILNGEDWIQLLNVCAKSSPV